MLIQIPGIVTQSLNRNKNLMSHLAHLHGINQLSEKSSSSNWFVARATEGISVLLFVWHRSLFNSDFDANHDSPKGEVNQNVFVNFDDVSDIFKDIYDDKEDSSCLKSLWKSRLCKFPLTLTSSKPLCNRRTISLCFEDLELTVIDFAETIGSRILQAPESSSPSSSRASLAQTSRPSSPARR